MCCRWWYLCLKKKEMGTGVCRVHLRAHFRDNRELHRTRYDRRLVISRAFLVILGSVAIRCFRASRAARPHIRHLREARIQLKSKSVGRAAYQQKRQTIILAILIANSVKSGDRPRLCQGTERNATLSGTKIGPVGTQ